VLAKWSYEVKREARIEHGVTLIASLEDNETGPATLIRAVNHLHSLGHEDAIETLTRFAKSYPFNGTVSGTKIFNLELLIPLLFVPKDSEAKLPSPDWDRKNWPASKNHYSLDRNNWDLPIELSSDIPFDTEWRLVSSTGVRLEQTYLIEWAKQDGRLRDLPLVPSDDPFTSAVNAANSQLEIEMQSGNSVDPEYVDELRINIENHMCEQVFEMVANLVPDFVAPEWNNWSGDKDKWQELGKTCESRGLYWNPDTQQYALARSAE